MLHAVMQFALFAQEKEAPATSPFLQLMPFVLIIVVFYFLIILPAQRRDKKQRQMLYNELKVNDEVLTSAGIIGQVKALNDEEVTIKVDDNARLRMLRSSIVKIIDKEKEAAKEGEQKS